MITLCIRNNARSDSSRELLSVESRAGLSFRAIAFEFERHLPKRWPILAFVNGELVPDERLDDDVADGSFVTLSPMIGTGIEIGTILITALISTAASFAISYIASLLSPRPKPPGLPQERGDEQSATYAWDQIQTQFGQGFPVPFVYGRHAVGGQVISTSIFASTLGAAPDDRVHLVLALSEGPIRRVGDVVADELDGLGGIASGGIPGAPLPDELRVNGNLLDTQTTASPRRQITSTTWNSTPDGIGDTIEVWDQPGTTKLGELQITRLNNAFFTDLDCIVTDGPETLGAVNNVLRFADGPVVGTSRITSALTVQRLNENPGARVWIRPGTLDQSALPSNPFRGSTSTFSPGQALNEFDEELVYTYAVNEPITTVLFTLSFPGGLYAQDVTGRLLPYSVRVECTWRRVGETSWRAFFQPQSSNSFFVWTISQNTITPAIVSRGGDLTQRGSPPVRGPIEVRIKRRSPSGGLDTVSSCVWRNVGFNREQLLAYPRVALLGLELAAGSRFSGGIPQVSVRIDGCLVRVWDEVDGWSEECWDVPAAPHDFNTYPPGRNPAWVAIAFLLADWGLGKWLTESDIDLPAFRRWAAFCDSEPSPLDPWGEASFSCDIVCDSPRPSWEVLLQICATGRATPIWANGKISVVYQYRDAHSDAGISVAAKTATQLFTTSSVQDLQVTWIARANRPTAYQFQYLNETSNFAQDVLTVPDNEGTLDDPSALDQERWRPEVVQAYGVTRPSQLFREGIFRHRATRLIPREISFSTGPWALALTIGDLFLFEHDILRPFGADVPMNRRVAVSATASATLIVEGALTGATAIVVRNPDGEPISRGISAVLVGIDGTSTLTLTGGTVTANAGANCVVGLAAKLVETYETVAITTEQELRRGVRAVAWVSEIHEPVTRSDYVAGGVDGGVDGPEGVLRQSVRSDQPERVASTRVSLEPDGASYVLWSLPPGLSDSSVRVWVFAEEGDAWEMLGEARGTELRVEFFSPGRTYELALSCQQADGRFPPPESCERFEFLAPEFAGYGVPRVSNLEVVDLGDELAVRWDAIDVVDFDVYELRVGTCWTSGEVVERTKTPRASLRVYGGTLAVAVRARSGLYGPATTIALDEWRPRATTLVASRNEFSGTPGGTHSGTVFATDRIELDGDDLVGTYETLELDVGYQAEAFWQISVDREELEERTVAELRHELDGGETRWLTLNGRPASPRFPGIDWQTVVDDLAMPISDIPSSVRVGSSVGETGSHSRILFESRYFADAAWSAWRIHLDGWRIASKIQCRATLSRESTRFVPSFSRFKIAASL
jgi:hypothetical protein